MGYVKNHAYEHLNGGAQARLPLRRVHLPGWGRIPALDAAASYTVGVATLTLCGFLNTESRMTVTR